MALFRWSPKMTPFQKLKWDGSFLHTSLRWLLFKRIFEMTPFSFQPTNESIRLYPENYFTCYEWAIATFNIKSDGPWAWIRAADSRVRNAIILATTVTDRTSTNRRHIVMGRLAYFVLSYLYVYPHVTLPGPRKSTSSSMKSSLSAPYALLGPCGTSVITGHSEIINETLLYLSWVPVQSSYRPLSWAPKCYE